MAVNKVVRSTGDVLIDLTADTVVPEVLLSGYTAHNAAGVPITGTASGGSVNYRTQAQWDAMTFEQRKAAGLTLIGTPADAGCSWYDFSNLDDTYIDFEHPLLSNMSYGTVGIDETFTAPRDGYYLVLNYETYGMATDIRVSGATTTTTGAFVWKNTYPLDFSWGLYQRDTVFDLALVQLEAGDTVTLSNNHAAANTAQVHLVAEVMSDITVVSELCESSFMNSTPRNQETFTPSGSGEFIVLAMDNCPGGGTPSTSFTLSGAEELSHYTAVTGLNSIYIGEYIMTAESSIQMTASASDALATKTFAAWAVS